ncbi:hypothetical protein DOTSEDRAFT_75424 [Dothistroma septosporum NZE10]|uniref:Uncharacterized protein n=1 Tax=Dothistroma septosporum (strain NZE10 / CBS 128990) TaxID=675120 RepID=M2Y004_DOTSN|nr:hypothetical protein DOTSEDRAFT_75424 [Dothistroma septosporum NZE10]
MLFELANHSTVLLNPIIDSELNVCDAALADAYKTPADDDPDPKIFQCEPTETDGGLPVKWNSGIRYVALPQSLQHCS